MALWLTRAGRHGEHEKKFLEEVRLYLTWNKLHRDLSKFENMKALYDFLPEIYPSYSEGKRRQNTGQLWSFSHRMKPGDWVVVPSRLKPSVIHFAEITAPYVYDPEAENPYYHYLEVKWIATDIPRSIFEQDLRYSFGAATTVCGIKRNDAETRVRAMAATGWKSVVAGPIIVPSEEEDEGEGGSESTIELEQLARDEIAKLIIRKYKGHGMEILVEEILKAQGYTTYRSSVGADKGVDILAAPGPLGFGKPRICVQVKTQDAPVDRPTLDQLLGTMQNVQADQGLLVSWSGFKSSIDRETAHHFFRVRLWDQDALIEQLLEHYNEIDEELRAELPLKRIWTVAAQEESS